MCGFCMEAGMLQSMYRGITMDFAEWDIQENPSLLAILQRVRTEDHASRCLKLMACFIPVYSLFPVQQFQCQPSSELFLDFNTQTLHPVCQRLMVF